MHSLRKATLALAIALTAATTQAQTANYFSLADISVTVIDVLDEFGDSMGFVPIGLDISGIAELDEQIGDSIGNATDEFNVLTDPMIFTAFDTGDGTTQMTDVLGSAGPGDGSAQSFVRTSGTLELSNDTSDTLTVVFGVLFQVETVVTADNPLDQLAEAAASVAINSFSPFFPSEIILNVSSFVTTNNTNNDFSQGGAFEFEIILDAATFVDLAFTTEIDGYAESTARPIPAPAALPAGIALMGMLGLRRNRLKA